MKLQNLNDHLDKVQEKIGYRFDNIDLLLQAFTRSSYSTQYGGENNEVLEFIGDNVLDLYVVKTLADRFGFMKSQSDFYDKDNDNEEFCIVAHKKESDFTDIKKEIVSNKTLAKRIDSLGFAKYMYLGNSDIDNNVISQEKVKADLFEAILGAIAIDSDWDAESLQNSTEYMLDIDKFLANVDTEEKRPDKFKEEYAVTTLKELAEHGYCSIPKYDLSDEQVEQNGRLWWACTCTVRNWNIRKTVLSTTKKGAKKYAAYQVLCEHYDLPDEFDESND